MKNVLLMGIAFLLIPVYWTVFSSVNDIQREYCFGRNLSQFIKENKLEEAKIFDAWIDRKEELSDAEYESKYTLLSGMLDGYFIIPGKSDYKETYEQWRNNRNGSNKVMDKQEIKI